MKTYDALHSLLYLRSIQSAMVAQEFLTQTEESNKEELFFKFIYFKREREREHGQGRGRERE